ncbi:uncharacterized protein LOC135599019 isoform X2 [Musa acuminata AAA Group]|uniref:uncharacterized protein LOC135599019 isoform X2 n=1 Tax=Musa acuminata AAA Group TaxID=214697 RepID=UPI0031CEA31F
MYMSPMAAVMLSSAPRHVLSPIFPPPDNHVPPPTALPKRGPAFRRLPSAVLRSAIRSIYVPESTSAAPFPGALGSSRSDWQTNCAILASKAASNSSSSSSSGGDNAGAASNEPRSSNDGNHYHLTSPTPVNGLKQNSATLDLVPVANLPRPLSISDLSPSPKHGSSVRVAYQGVPGAYSEAAAGKAYPNCEAIPCDQFEVAFQAVELWIADRAVLPVENSLGGSIHRNYDLLLRHRLHIVGAFPVRADADRDGTQRGAGGLRRHGRRRRVRGQQRPPGHGGHRVGAGGGAVQTAGVGGRHPRRQRQRDAVRDAGAGAHHSAHRPALQDQHRVRPRPGGHLRPLQGALRLRLPGHQPDQDRKPAAPPPAAAPGGRRQRGHRQALRVHVLRRLRSVHGGDPRPESPRRGPGVHLLPPRARQLPDGYDSLGRILLAVPADASLLVVVTLIDWLWSVSFLLSPI